MFKFYRTAAALMLVTVAMVAGCEQQSAPPATPADSSINDSGTGNAPNVGDGEPSAASP